MKYYRCLDACFFRQRLHREGVVYAYPDEIVMPVHKDGRPLFEQVGRPGMGAEPAQAGGLGEVAINPAPDIRQPLVVDTTEQKESVRTPKARGPKSGVAAQSKPGTMSKE